VTDEVAPSPPVVDQSEDAAGQDDELLGLIDRLAELLHRSDLLELEVESGGTGLILRKAVAQPALTTSGANDTGARSEHGDGEPSAAGREPVAPAIPSVKAPLTGIFYASPAPGSAPYVQVGGELAVGQVIGLIEAMKLFNEIKSDLAGRVIRVLPESGSLVKAKQPLIEVEPL
jgi:acetyl-CoA carboxylase biotin carboxyl carrier protein